MASILTPPRNTSGGPVAAAKRLAELDQRRSSHPGRPFAAGVNGYSRQGQTGLVGARLALLWALSGRKWQKWEAPKGHDVARRDRVC